MVMSFCPTYHRNRAVTSPSDGQMIGTAADGAVFDVLLIAAGRDIKRYDDHLAARRTDVVGIIGWCGKLGVRVIMWHSPL